MVFGAYNFGMRRTIENHRNTMHNALNLDKFLKFFRSKLCGRRIRSVQTYTKPCVFLYYFQRACRIRSGFCQIRSLAGYAQLAAGYAQFCAGTLSLLAGYAQLLAGYAQLLAGYAQFPPDTLSWKNKKFRRIRSVQKNYKSKPPAAAGRTSELMRHAGYAQFGRPGRILNNTRPGPAWIKMLPGPVFITQGGCPCGAEKILKNYVFPLLAVPAGL